MAEKETLFCDTLDAVQEYLALQDELGRVLRSGFIHLSTARYSMGVKRVSLLQVPATMVASTVVERGADGDLRLNDACGARARSSPEPVVQLADAAPVSELLAELGEKYGCDKPTGMDDEEDDENDDDKIGGKNNASASNPLDWFGAMVAPSMRDAQNDFTKALQLLIELANRQRRIVEGTHAIRDVEGSDNR